ncbi:MAG TPA: peptide deformylase [Myxococcaceae bacterium]|nr:peptide deformylase [Myxococcaceae bacterium]
MLRDIIIWPDPILKKPTEPVTAFDESLRALVADMFETMYSADGVGLAAPQVGQLKSIITLDTRVRQPESKPTALINPVILKTEGTSYFLEGCLSLPGEAEEIERAKNVRVKYQDVDGTEHEMDCEGLFATVVQHEADHLKGVMLTDHLSVLKRELMRKRMKRIKASMDAERERDSRASL